MSDENVPQEEPVGEAAEIDGAEIARILDGITGTHERLALARGQIARGEAVSLDDL